MNIGAGQPDLYPALRRSMPCRWTRRRQRRPRRPRSRSLSLIRPPEPRQNVQEASGAILRAGMTLWHPRRISGRSVLLDHNTRHRVNLKPLGVLHVLDPGAGDLHMRANSWYLHWTVKVQAALASSWLTGSRHTISNTRFPFSWVLFPAFRNFSWPGSNFSQPWMSPSGSWRTPSLRWVFWLAVASTIVPVTVTHFCWPTRRAGLQTWSHNVSSQAGDCASTAVPEKRIAAAIASLCRSSGIRQIIDVRCGGGDFLALRQFSGVDFQRPSTSVPMREVSF